VVRPRGFGGWGGTGVVRFAHCDGLASGAGGWRPLQVDALSATPAGAEALAIILRCASLDRGARHAAARPMRPALHADRCSCSAAGAGDADAEDANAPSDGRVADAEVRILRKLARSQVRSYDLNPPLPCAPAALSWCSAARSVASRNAVDGATAAGAAISRRSRFMAGVALQTTWRTCRGLLAACRSRPFVSMRSQSVCGVTRVLAIT
jgi:hypothetical protein